MRGTDPKKQIDTLEWVNSRLVRALGKNEVVLHVESDSIEDRVGNRLTLDARSRETCIHLRWAAVLRDNRSTLAKLGLSSAECSYRGSVVWSGLISQLPTSIQETRCASPLRGAMWEPDPTKRTAFIAYLPLVCRGHMDAVAKAHAKIISAASSKNCLEVNRLQEQLKRVDPEYHRRLIWADPKLQYCFNPVAVICSIVGPKKLPYAQVLIESHSSTARSYKFVVYVHSQGETSSSGVVEGRVGAGKSETRRFRGFPPGQKLDSCRVVVDQSAANGKTDND